MSLRDRIVDRVGTHVGYGLLTSASSQSRGHGSRYRNEEWSVTWNDGEEVERDGRLVDMKVAVRATPVNCPGWHRPACRVAWH